MAERKGFELVAEVERLQKLLEKNKLELSTLQKNCDHKWAKSIYDPEKVSRFVFTHLEPHGSDPIPRGYYVPEDKPRWSRTCETCGKKEYTYERKPIITSYEPSF